MITISISSEAELSVWSVNIANVAMDFDFSIEDKGAKLETVYVKFDGYGVIFSSVFDYPTFCTRSSTLILSPKKHYKDFFTHSW